MKKHLYLPALFTCLATMFTLAAMAQAGVTASPSRLYFNSSANGSKSQKITITNPSEKPLEIGVSVSNWDYDSVGNNRIYTAGKLRNSAASSIKVLPGSYFTLKTNEPKEVTIQFKPGSAKKTYQTGMIFFTQLNPGPAQKSNGATIKLTVRIGVKVYYTPKASETVAVVDIQN